MTRYNRHKLENPILPFLSMYNGFKIVEAVCWPKRQLKILLMKIWLITSGLRLRHAEFGKAEAEFRLDAGENW